MTTHPPKARLRAGAAFVLALLAAGSARTHAQPAAPSHEPPPTVAAAPSPPPPPAPPSPSPPPPPAAARPWRVAEAVHSPSWLRFGAEERLRYEHLQNDFRAKTPGDWNAFVMRTLVTAELRFRWFALGGEFEDSRVYATDGTPLNTNLVDAVEPLQAYAGVRLTDVAQDGDQLSITAGRMTLDVGSRRLVARNDFRNTINAFTGLDAQWTTKSRHLVRTFAVMPVIRRPTSASELADNAIEVDLEDTPTWLFGAFYASPVLFAETMVEAYVFGLDENDSARFQTANRHLVTPGFRLLRRPARGHVDYQLEAMGQFGHSHATTSATDTTNLLALAWAAHVQVGYRFEAAWSPRLAVVWDYASGDRSPTDDQNNRFDPLYGARRWEWGPTSLYGALSRSNMDSPGIRLELEPHRMVDAYVGYRACFLAAARDAWVTAGVQDTTGQSGKFIGNQFDARIRFTPFPRNLVFDVGGAYLLRGAFAKDAPVGGRSAPSIYFYTQITGTI
ncbi:MAG: alginate export family protein [Polyangiales bacterium]